MADKISATSKKSRGRPKTAFVSKKPKIKQSGPGRPKKNQEIMLPITPKEPNFTSKKLVPEDNKKKDAFILAMFIVSLILFAASLFFSQKKQDSTEQEISTPATQEELITGTSEIETGAEITGTESTGEVNTGAEVTTIQTKLSVENLLVNSFYDALNKEALDQIYPNVTPGLKASNLFRTYFSKTRIQRFIKSLSSEGVQISNVQSDNKPNPTVNYKLSYTLQNGTPFEETREMQIINKDTPQIAKMMCINTGCSKLPFFNPGKYPTH